MKRNLKRPLAIFVKGTNRRIDNFILFVRALLANIAANITFFPTPDPTLVVANGNLARLEDAQAVALTRVVGGAAKRDVALNLVNNDVLSQMAYVQKLADKADSEAKAIAIIEAAGFQVKKTPSFEKPPLAARNTKSSGTIKLTAKAYKGKAIYSWSISMDDMATWRELPQTLIAKTEVANQLPTMKLWFRVMISTTNFTGFWSDPVSVVVS
jgi:hypothetical protein